MSKQVNKFAAFADPEEVQAAQAAAAQQQKKQSQKDTAGKKVVIKKAAAPKVDQEEFEKVDNTRPQTASRGNRGSRGNDRGGRGERRGDRDGERGGRGERRGGRGERRGDRDGERGGRGGRGERGGRGGRPRTGLPAEEGSAQVDRAEAGGRRGRDRFQGKAREDAHPMDRKDGTGKAHRGDRKGGNTRGGWEGKDDAPKDEETKGAAVEEEKRERKPRPEPVEEEEEEEVGYTLDDFMADKQAKSTGLLAAKQNLRQREKIQDKVLTREGDKERVLGRDNQLGARELYAVRPDVNANLLGFQAPLDDDFEERSRGRGRGGRGGAERGPREPRQGGRKGGRGGRLVVDDEAFPAL